MYLLDRSRNKITRELPERSFRELKFEERAHLQQWIAQRPEMLGEDLLIIQEEFDGFNDTRERLDLLALDKEGNLVVIENKLDDTGRDVTWQVLKYASYCSTMKKEQIRNVFQQYLDRKGQQSNATELLLEFFDAEDYSELSLNLRQTQRIIMVAGNFRKEVTSTVLWLMNYKLRIQCFRASVYALEEQILLDVEQVIPTPDSAEYIISIAEKVQEDLTTQNELRESHHLRREFWSLLLDRLRGRTPIYQNVSASTDHWLSSGKTGHSGVNYSCLATRRYASVRLNIGTKDKEVNESFIRNLMQFKDKIENDFGHELEWLPRPKIKSSQIDYRITDVSLQNREDWETMLDFLSENMVKLERALREPLRKIKQL